MIRASEILLVFFNRLLGTLSPDYAVRATRRKKGSEPIRYCFVGEHTVNCDETANRER